MTKAASDTIAAPPRPSRLQPIKVPARLIVPCHSSDREQPAVIKIPGTVVRAGESLLEESRANTAASRAPVDGRIVGPAVAPIHRGLSMAAVEFEPLDPQAIKTPFQLTSHDLSHVDGMGPAELARRLQSLGIWADRWASPNLLAQLREPHKKPIDTILCNALDEDPAVPLQANVAADQPSAVIAGVRALAAACGAGRAMIALAYGAPAPAWEGLRQELGDSKVRLVPVVNEYPQAHPVLIVHELTGRHLRPGQLPTEQRVLLLDAAAAAAVGNALAANQPLLSAPLAVHDYLRRSTHFFIVPVGTRVRDVLEQMNVQTENVELRAGCPLREIVLTPDCVVSGAELTVAIVPAVSHVNPEPCIRCAWCVEGCPVRIRPASLLDAAQQEDLYMAGQFGLDACIECGICSYVCPSQLPLLGGIRMLRTLQAGSRSARNDVARPS